MSRIVEAVLYWGRRKKSWKNLDMALNIKHPEADQLARALAEITGQSITDSVIRALREQLRRETGRFSVARLRDEIRIISDRCAALPDYDARSPEEILGFDEHGLPS